MEITKAKKEELSGLVRVYKEGFAEHNIFKQSYDKVVEYLEITQERDEETGGGYLIARAEEHLPGSTQFDSEIVGGLLISKVGEGSDGHTRWRYKHIAVAKEQRGKGIGKALIQKADEMVQQMIKEGKIKTARVEVRAAEGEKESIPFYEKSGFKLESTTEHYYRANEPMYTLMKFFS